MKIGFDMMLWTTNVTEAHLPILEDIKRTGYDGVEIPLFEGTPDDYEKLGRMIAGVGLERTGITVIGTADMNPLSADPADRKRGVAYMQWVLECCNAMGARVVGGPLHSTLGVFSGDPLTPDERARALDFHREVGEIAARNDVNVALEAINRFESYFANTMDILGRYVADVNHPNIKAMYDTFHANIEEADPVAAYTKNAQHVVHVHISENDRGVPGRGHVPWAATYQAIRDSGYDGWMTIEAFGRSLPALAAATKIWRDLSEGPEAVYRDGFLNIRNGWAAAAKKKRAPAKRTAKAAAAPKREAKAATPKRKAKAATAPKRAAKAAARPKKPAGAKPASRRAAKPASVRAPKPAPSRAKAPASRTKPAAPRKPAPPVRRPPAPAAQRAAGRPSKGRRGKGPGRNR